MFVDQALIANLMGVVDAATPEGTEGRIQIPPIVSPTILLSRPLVAVLSGQDIHRLSGLREGTIAQAASAAASATEIMRLANGIWRIQVIHTFISDFSQGVGDSHSRVDVTLDNDSTVQLSRLHADNAARRREMVFPLTVRLGPTSTNMFVSFSLRAAATGVGETTRGDCTIIATKYL